MYSLDNVSWLGPAEQTLMTGSSQVVEPDSVFDAAAAHVASLAGGDVLGDEHLLQLYGLYKQATCGPCLSFRPPFFDRRARSKWAAWKALGNLPQADAREQYVAAVSSLSPDWDRRSASRGGGPGGPVFSSLGAGAAEGEEDRGISTANRLHLAASEGDAATVSALLGAGQDVNARDEDGCTALHWAADRGCTEVVEQLLQRGAEVDAHDLDGQTPMHYAALCKQREVCTLLLHAGADASLRDRSGRRPQDMD